MRVAGGLERGGSTLRGSRGGDNTTFSKYVFSRDHFSSLHIEKVVRNSEKKRNKKGF